jgi:hypothetical protein
MNERGSGGRTDVQGDAARSKPQPARAQRLAAALKSNLRRRKSQARARADVGPDADVSNSAASDGTSPPAEPHDSARIADHKQSG